MNKQETGRPRSSLRDVSVAKRMISHHLNFNKRIDQERENESCLINNLQLIRLNKPIESCMYLFLFFVKLIQFILNCYLCLLLFSG